MSEHLSLEPMEPLITPPDDENRLGARLQRFPWWFLGLILIALSAIYIIITNTNYNEAFNFIKPGIMMTVNISLISYGFALILGLLAGIGRLSKNVFFNNLARLYIEFVRGIPMLVLIFFIAFVGVPTVLDLVDSLGIANLDIQSISMENRAVIALAVTYGAFLAEIFRAGIQSIGGGQTEAARSLGMTQFQAMRFIILPWQMILLLWLKILHWFPYWLCAILPRQPACTPAAPSDSERRTLPYPSCI